MPPTDILTRAQAWNGTSLPSLENLLSDLNDMYFSVRLDDEEDTDDLSKLSDNNNPSLRELRSALTHLLSYPTLPYLHRAHFLVLMAATEQDGEFLAAREWLEGAKECIARVARPEWLVGRVEGIEIAVRNVEGMLDEMVLREFGRLRGKEGKGE